MQCDETLVQCWPQFILHPQTAPLKKFSHRFDIQLHIPLTSRKAHQTVMTMKGVRYRMTNDLHTNFIWLYNFSFQFHRRAAEPGCAAAHTPTLWITDLKNREIIWLFASKKICVCGESKRAAASFFSFTNKLCMSRLWEVVIYHDSQVFEWRYFSWRYFSFISR